MMTSAQIPKTSVNVNTNSSQDYTHPDDHTLPTQMLWLLGSNHLQCKETSVYKATFETFLSNGWKSTIKGIRMASVPQQSGSHRWLKVHQGPLPPVNQCYISQACKRPFNCNRCQGGVTGKDSVIAHDIVVYLQSYRVLHIILTEGTLLVLFCPYLFLPVHVSPFLSLIALLCRYLSLLVLFYPYTSLSVLTWTHRVDTA